MPHPNWRIEARRVMRQSSRHQFVSATTTTTTGSTADLGHCKVCGAQWDHRNHDTNRMAEIIQFPVRP
jgi:hypothetical protein